MIGRMGFFALLFVVVSVNAWAGPKPQAVLGALEAVTGRNEVLREVEVIAQKWSPSPDVESIVKMMVERLRNAPNRRLFDRYADETLKTVRKYDGLMRPSDLRPSYIGYTQVAFVDEMKTLGARLEKGAAPKVVKAPRVRPYIKPASVYVEMPKVGDGKVRLIERSAAQVQELGALRSRLKERSVRVGEKDPRVANAYKWLMDELEFRTVDGRIYAETLAKIQDAVARNQKFMSGGSGNYEYLVRNGSSQLNNEIQALYRDLYNRNQALNGLKAAEQLSAIVQAPRTNAASRVSNAGTAKSSGRSIPSTLASAAGDVTRASAASLK